MLTHRESIECVPIIKFLPLESGFLRFNPESEITKYTRGKLITILEFYSIDRKNIDQ